MPTTPDQLTSWLAEPEGVRLEFKEAKQRYDFEKLLLYCVALANEGGGKIILGVTDRRPRHIVGTAAFAEPGRTEAGLYKRLARRVPIEELNVSGRRVLIFHVPARLAGGAWQIDGRYLKRAGDELVPLGDSELRAIHAEAGPDFSAEFCAEAQVQDLSASAISVFRDRWARRRHDARISSWSDAQTLENAELTVGGQVTYAALILLGSPAALGRWLSQAELVFEYRASEASGPAADRVTYREGFLAWQDALWAKINQRNDRQSYQDDFFRMDLLTFDEIPVREAVLNAVAHRDYRLGGSIFVRQYQKRLEIVSPGGLPQGITPEKTARQPSRRGRRIASSCTAPWHRASSAALARRAARLRPRRRSPASAPISRHTA